MKVCARRCDQCLYGKDRIVSTGRAAGIMMDIVKTDSHFICHKSQIRGDKVEAICKGSYDQHPGQLIRIMGRLGGIEYVDPETGKEMKEETNA